MRTTKNIPYFQRPPALRVQIGPAKDSLLAETGQRTGKVGHGSVRQDRPPSLSLVIPNRNGSAMIGQCLAAAFRAVTDRDEVIVVDDCSTDDSAEIISQYPCRLVRLDRHAGASRARNIGALHSRGELLFFTDADCLVREDTLALARTALTVAGPGTVFGGTYTAEPQDRDFFSRFQSVFINHAETRRPLAPDYVASHAMAVHRRTFLESGGFSEDFLPIIEDVELSHRLRQSGCRLVIRPDIQVQHIFGFSLARSLMNGVRKSRYWTRYSLKNRDLFADSGTASRGLKTNVLAWTLSLAAACGGAAFAHPALLAVIPVLMGASAVANQSLLAAWQRTGGAAFSIAAAAYYLLISPAAVAAGGLLGLAEHITWAGKRNLPLRTQKGCSA